MQATYDCGVVAMANLTEILRTTPADVTRKLIEQKHPQPKTWPRCDLWDSPTRHLKVMRELLRDNVGPLPAHDLVPCVALFRVGWLAWHWVTIVGRNPEGRLITHTGASFLIGDPADTWGRPWFVYSVGGSEPMPLLWRIWGWLTSWI